MAADRQRLAQALAAEAARRKMFESIPEAAGQGLPQAPERPMGWNDYLENLSIGLGRGAVNNLEGVKSAITSPIETAKGFATGVAEAVRNPRMVAEALKQTGQRAMSGPLGLGEVIGENVNMMRVPGKPVMHELDVYHGTPHRFPATETNPLGEFDASKIGTGVGAQAYGRGIYLAQNPTVAGMFKNPAWQDDQIINALKTPTLTKNEYYTLGELMRKSYSRTEKLTSAEQATLERLQNQQEKVAQELDAARKNASVVYKADLPDEMIDRMLDWDKPLRDQPEIYKKVLADKDWRNRLRSRTDKQVGELTGADLYQMGHDQTVRLGIPGIKYLFEGNQAAGGTGNRNFVVFPGEEKKVRILERK